MITSLDDLQAALQQFADERDWEQFHSPKNLAMALGVEVAELAEHFQWLTQQQSLNLAAEKKQEVGEELADILIYLVRLADRLDINLEDAISKKINKNALRYTVEASRGSAAKR